MIIFDFFTSLFQRREVPRPEPPYFSRQVDDARRFYFPPRFEGGLQIESGGWEKCPAFYNVERDYFPFHVLEFIARGSAHIQLGKAKWTLQPGSVYAYHRDLPHRLSSRSPDGMTKYFLILRGTGARALLLRHGIIPGRVIRVEDLGRITDIFDDLIEAGGGTRRDRMTDCLAIFRYLLLKIEELAVSNERIASGAYSAYRKCVDYMDRHYVELHSAAEVAAACQVDSSYLCRLFQRFGGESPYHHLLRLRMDYAARRIGSGTVSVKELSEELGFADPAAFSRAFKRTFGVSPHHVRSQAAAPDISGSRVIAGTDWESGRSVP